MCLNFSGFGKINSILIHKEVRQVTTVCTGKQNPRIPSPFRFKWSSTDSEMNNSTGPPTGLFEVDNGVVRRFNTTPTAPTIGAGPSGTSRSHVRKHKTGDHGTTLESGLLLSHITPKLLGVGISQKCEIGQDVSGVTFFIYRPISIRVSLFNS